MSAAKRPRAKEPKYAHEAELKSRFYRGFTWGTMWGGLVCFIVWAAHQLLGGRLPFATASLGIVPLAWGFLHRLVMVPFARRAIRDRVRQKKARAPSKASESGGSFVRSWAKAVAHAARSMLRRPPKLSESG